MLLSFVKSNKDKWMIKGAHYERLSKFCRQLFQEILPETFTPGFCGIFHGRRWWSMGAGGDIGPCAEQGPSGPRILSHCGSLIKLAS